MSLIFPSLENSDNMETDASSSQIKFPALPKGSEWDPIEVLQLITVTEAFFKKIFYVFSIILSVSPQACGRLMRVSSRGFD